MKYLTDCSGTGRVPTFFTYRFGERDRNWELPETCQGPHTIAHRYIMELVKKKYWEDIFMEQIAPYPPEEIKRILKGERCWGFRGQELYLYDYRQLYFQLQTWKTCNVLSEIDAGAIPEGSRLYTVVQNSIVCIMEMHPYGSYGWNRPMPDDILQCEIAGKSERVIELALRDKQATVIVDTHARFCMGEDYKNFICTRLEREEGEQRNEIVQNWDKVVYHTILQEYQKLIQDFRDKVEDCRRDEWNVIGKQMNKPLVVAWCDMEDLNSYTLREVGRALMQLSLLMMYYRLPKGAVEIEVWEPGRETSGEEPRKKLLRIDMDVRLGSLVEDIISEGISIEPEEYQGEEEEEEEEEDYQEEEEQQFVCGELSFIAALDLHVFLHGGRDNLFPLGRLLEVGRQFRKMACTLQEKQEWLWGQWGQEREVAVIEANPEGILSLSYEELCTLERERGDVLVCHYPEEDIYSIYMGELSKAPFRAME